MSESEKQRRCCLTIKTLPFTGKGSATTSDTDISLPIWEYIPADMGMNPVCCLSPYLCAMDVQVPRRPELLGRLAVNRRNHGCFLVIPEGFAGSWL